ncbi:MAG: hypothetical protein R2851_16675 [Caldilineaceae bacterium]
MVFVCDIINEGHVTIRDKWAKEFSEATIRGSWSTISRFRPTTTPRFRLAAAGTPPDMYRHLQEITPIITVAEKNLHLQVDDYIARDEYDVDASRPTPLRSTVWDGTYALPRTTATRISTTTWNILEEAGVTLPPVLERHQPAFDVFLDMLLKVTKRDGDRTTQWGFLVNRGQRPWASWVYSNGGVGAIRDDRGVATDSAMADEGTVEALAVPSRI